MTQPRTPARTPPRVGTGMRLVLGIVALVLALCCVGTATGGFLLVRSVHDETGPIGELVDGFLDKLQAGDAAGAYRDLCASTRSRLSQEQFVAYVAARPRPTGHRRISVNLSTFNGQVRGDVLEEIRYADQPAERHRFIVIREAPAWWVCGDPY
jgi:hypothetical protein